MHKNSFYLNSDAGNIRRCIPKIYAFLGYCPLRFPKSFGEKLRFRRKALGLTQCQLAKKIGVDQSTIRDWEKGEHQPIMRSLTKVRDILKWV